MLNFIHSVDIRLFGGYRFHRKDVHRIDFSAKLFHTEHYFEVMLKLQIFNDKLLGKLTYKGK